MKICILIPVHNESKKIKAVVESIDKNTFDVAVLDDGSEDNSGEIATKAGATVLRHDAKSGKGATIQRGFDYALEKNYDAVILMDGDGQHDAADLNHFLEQAKVDPKSIITGNRMQDSKGMPLVRSLTNRFMSMLISMACKQKVPDTQCGFRYIHCDVLKNIKIECTGFEIETEILIKASKNGVKISSVPIKTIYADEESHINPVRDTVRFFKYFFKEIFSK